MGERRVVVITQRRFQITLTFHREPKIVQGEWIPRVELQSLAQNIFGLLTSSPLEQGHGLNVPAIDSQFQVAIRRSDLAQFVAL